jgi:thermostable 8-oxoguanine DNA glycosylase
MDTTKPDQFFASFNELHSHKVEPYKQYWESLRPKTDEDIFRRWLFAFCSVHTTWKGNINGYLAIRDFVYWKHNRKELLKRLTRSGVGCQKERTDYIWDFSKDFWQNPKDFSCPTKRNRYVSVRDNLVERIRGLSYAKVSFSFEMIDPLFARVLCGDVHHLRFYGMADLKYTKSKVGATKYKAMEQHWMENCQRLNVPSYIARCIMWDDIQKKPDSDYWGYVLKQF